MLLSITHLLAVFKMQNASAGVNQDCLKAQKPEDMWKCMFAPVSTFTSSCCIIYDPPPPPFILQYTYSFIKTPLFVLNSMYDTAQINSLFGLPCLPPNCNRTYLEEFYDYGQV